MDSSAPRNLYDLCEMTAQAIEQHPANYCQQDWEASLTRVRDLWSYDPEVLNHEACGTAYCRAGWMVNLLEKPSRSHTNIPEKARALLLEAGIPSIAITNLFSANASGSKVGSKDYVNKGVSGLREFMNAYETQLKSYSLEGVLDKDGRINFFTDRDGKYRIQRT